MHNVYRRILKGFLEVSVGAKRAPLLGELPDLFRANIHHGSQSNSLDVLQRPGVNSSGYTCSDDADSEHGPLQRSDLLRPRWFELKVDMASPHSRLSARATPGVAA